MSLTLPESEIGPSTKSFPPALWRSTPGRVASAMLSDFATPVMTLDVTAMSHNESTVFDWARAQGVLLAPHAKTTMSPALWERLLDAGSWGLTVATPWQAQLAIWSGVPRVLLGNDVADIVGFRSALAVLRERPGQELFCWVDSVDGVRRIAEAVHAEKLGSDLGVLVELGGMAGRTGARSREEALAVAEAIENTEGLRLAGVGGYEGPFGPDRSPESIGAVDSYLESLRDLFDVLAPRIEGRPLLTAGGSSWPDRVAHILGARSESADVLLRSGAFQVHDDGFYVRMGPFGRDVDTAPLRSAMHVWARVISTPEAGLALLDAGRRDVPFDIDLPFPQRLVRDGVVVEESLDDWAVTALNDQHAFVRVPDGATVRVGDVIRLGLSHPCTAFDKWRMIPLIDSPDNANPRVIGAVETCF